MGLQDLIASDASFMLSNTDDFATSGTVIRESTAVTTTAIIDQQEVRSRDRNGIMVSHNYVVLLFRATDYSLSDGDDYPKAFDEFVFGTRRYEPVTPEGKKDCWEYTNGTSTIIKVYCKEVNND